MTLTRREKEEKIRQIKAELRKKWATETPEEPALPEEEIVVRLGAISKNKNIGQLATESEGYKTEEEYLKNELRKAKRLEYFWSTYEFPAAIRKLRSGEPGNPADKGFMLGQRFTADDVYSKLRAWGLEKSEWDEWLEESAIENRHYQVMDKARQVDNKVTYIFI